MDMMECSGALELPDDAPPRDLRPVGYIRDHVGWLEWFEKCWAAALAFLIVSNSCAAVSEQVLVSFHRIQSGPSPTSITHYDAFILSTLSDHMLVTHFQPSDLFLNSSSFLSLPCCLA